MKSFFSMKRNAKPRQESRPLPATPLDVASKVAQSKAIAEESEQVDSKVASTMKENTEIETVNKPSTSAPVADKKNDEDIRTDAKSTELKLTPTMEKFWNLSLSYRMTQKSSGKYSEYVPNGIPLIKIIEPALRLMETSIHLSKYDSHFNPYAALTGFCYCYYFCILRARVAAGITDGYEGGIISRFEKVFPFNSIPIPDILFPYLSTITSVKFQDIKYGYIVPAFSYKDGDAPVEWTYNGTNTVYTDPHGLGLIMPNIPGMLMLLASLGNETPTTIQGKLDPRGKYTPAPLVGEPALFSITQTFDFRTAATATVATDKYAIFNTLGVSSEVRCPNSDSTSLLNHMKDSAFYGRKAVNFTAQGDLTNVDVTTLRQHVDFNRIDKFLNLSKDQTPTFFGYLLENMMIFCKYFKAANNLSDISPTGTLQLSIIADLRMQDEVDSVNHRHKYEDFRCGINTIGAVRWYPKKLKEMSANFTCSKAGITRAEELQALSFGTVCTPPVHALTTRHFLRGKFFEDVTGPESGRTNKYILGETDNDLDGQKPMYEQWDTVIIPSEFVSNGK